MTKAQLRAKYLSERKAISREERAAMSKGIADLFFSNFDLASVDCLHLFLPIERFNEVDTRLIVNEVWTEYPHVRTVVPRIDPDMNELTSARLTQSTELLKNNWQIEEPTTIDMIEPSEIDMVLVPGLAFDSDGHRVGYGKGYYDRFLKTCRPDCLKIGLSFFEPVDKIDDIHDGDERLDFVITPEAAIKY